MGRNISFSRNVLTLCADNFVLFGYQSPPIFISSIGLLPPCLLKDCSLHLNQYVCEVSWVISGTAATSHVGLHG